LNDESRPTPRGNVWIAAALGVGIVLRVCQYVSNQSYWQDEASLLLNSVKYSAGKLAFARLDATLNIQAAPPGFLWGIKALLWLSDGGEWVMRAMPFIEGIGAIVLVALLARRVMSPRTAALALAIAALSDHLIFEAATLKPYSGDFFMATLLLWVAGVWDEKILVRRFAMVGALAAAGLWTSYPVIFTFAGISLAAMMPMIRARRAATWVIANVAVMISFAFVYFLCIRAQRDPYLDKYWEDRFTTNIFHLFRMTLEIFRFVLPPLGIVLSVLALVGIIALWRSRRWTLLIALAAPFALVGLASMVHAYPYGGTRVTLFWAGNVAMLSALGVDAIIPRWWRCAAWTVGIAPVVAALYVAIPNLVHPRNYGDMRAVTAYVREKGAPSDLICVVGNGKPTLDWYWPDHGARVVRGIDAARVAGLPRFWVVDSYDPRQGRKGLAEHDRMSGFEIDEKQSLRIRGGDALLFVARGE
jgi:hypothetical protein